jgi:Relaxase/Mobilisation nuclease domain
MIVKGAARAGPTQLGNYLMRLYASADRNEYTELLELQSPWATPETPGRDRAAAQLVQTFRDWQILAEGTKQGRDGLYHAQISPAATYAMTPEQWIRAADILGEELGLQDQQRTIVLHGGEDRPHIHVVWARTDIDTMKLHSDSHNYLAHEQASKRMELEFGHEFVPGKHAKRDRDKQPEFPRAEMTQDECQQAERTGLDPARRKEQITALKQASDSARAFKAGLEEQGYILAKGDKRGFVLVDEAGEIYSLSRQIRGVKPAELREFMKGIDPQTLPTVDQAREAQKQQALTQRDALASSEPPVLKPPEPVSDPVQAQREVETEALRKAVTARHEEETRRLVESQTAELNDLRQTLDADTREKLDRLDALHRDQAEAQRRRRHLEQAPVGVIGFLNSIRDFFSPARAAQREADLRREQAQLAERQKQERTEYAALLRQTKELEIENFTERHAQQLRDHDTRGAEDLDRYIREQETARKLRAEIEERERERDEELTRDGPERPPPRAL